MRFIIFQIFAGIQRTTFLLGLCMVGKADYLVTGDHDLLDLADFEGTKIITANELSLLLEKVKD